MSDSERLPHKRWRGVPRQGWVNPVQYGINLARKRNEDYRREIESCRVRLVQAGIDPGPEPPLPPPVEPKRRRFHIDTMHLSPMFVDPREAREREMKAEAILDRELARLLAMLD